MKTVLTFGTYDLFHIGHVRLLERARALGDRLVVGVSTDQLNMRKKGRFPIYSQDQRIEIVRSLRCVDEAFFEESLEAKRTYLVEWRADVLVMGDDWQGRMDEFGDICEVHYLPRTENISSSELEAFIQTRLPEHLRTTSLSFAPKG